MAPNKGANRAKEFEDLDDFVPQEFDPEVDISDDDSDGSADGEDQDAREDNAREHYEEVGKSKLRKPRKVALGPQYRGSKVGRDAVGSEDEDDPFSKGFDEEDSDDELDGLEGDSGDEDAEDGTDATDLSDEDEEDEDDRDLSDGAAPRDEEMDRAELRKIMATEQKAVAASISAANKADAEKGRAVKKQRTAFDSLLNTRIKLQKSLIATNTLVDPSYTAPDPSALEAAESAAFNLWSTLTTFRDELTTARTGHKRKRPTLKSSAPLSKLWNYTREQEDLAQPYRNATLQKWSVKARGPTATPQASRLNNAAPQATIVDVLNEQLSAPDRLLRRAHTPRSCAPLQASAKTISDEQIYDDADFYGLLLKELLEARSAADSAVAANLDVRDFTGVRREAKTKRNVDVKASKGRKLKYTVHEKLQDFMAPEDTGTWGERQSRELFASLFGQWLDLGENGEDDNTAMDGLETGDEEEAGLMMFRK